MAITNILVPFDGSTYSVKAFNAALSIAKKQQAKISLLTCLEKDNLGAWYVDKRVNRKIMKDAKEFAMESLSKLEDTAKKSDVLLSVHIIETKSISKQIVDFASSKKINLIKIQEYNFLL